MIQQNKNINDYNELHKYILSQINAQKLKEIKSSGSNGKKPALCNSYWIVDADIDYTELIEELTFKIRPDISTDYYLSHLKEYEADREYVLLLNSYFENKQKFSVPMSLNERCFDIWKQEKFLTKGPGKTICKRCGVSMEQLSFYDTYEPLAYFTASRDCPQNILIIENKDTFFTMRRLMQQGQNTFWGVKIGTLIYGAGKGIVKAFKGLALSGEPYMLEKTNQFIYFGDLDYEGIQIYESLASSEAENYKISPFVKAYEKMLSKNYDNILGLPTTKEGQNRNIGTRFLEFFDQEIRKQFITILERDKYLPQECLNEADMTADMEKKHAI